MIWGFAAALVGLGAAGWIVRHRRRGARLEQARDVAEELLPEIRALMESADPKSASDGEPARARHYELCHQRLPQILSGEQYFAVETFFQCVESYREARVMMIDAFGEGEEPSLGDRIRAKDRRDRCLKDVYYTGHGAVEKLEQLLV